MEEEKKIWSSATNWIVVHGSLQEHISFESPIEEDNSARSESHLLLNSPSPDSSPCEITVNFRHQHEVRQVYVRSTARTYEIYYASDKKSSNEYLCTVRCGVVAKEDGILHEGDIGEVISEHQKGSSEATELPEGNFKNHSNNSSNEDGWVEVKVPDSPSLDEITNPISKKIDANSSRNIQDYYEATAEITDASPCISLTLRMLSLQTKGCVHVEEIYIFADPVESSDVSPQLGSVENSAGSSLYSMLVPSLLQLSKSRNDRIQNRHVSDIKEPQKRPDGELKATETVSPLKGKTIEQEKMVEPTRDRTEHVRFEANSTIPWGEQSAKSVPGENNLPYNHLESVLTQLLSRVGRIEAFCSRFEENMVQPLNCMATRLERVEKQLDALNLRSQSPTSLPCSSFNASESGTKNAPPEKPPSCPIDGATASSESATELYQGLVIFAPEFPNDDDDQDDGDDDDDDDDDDHVNENCNGSSDSMRNDVPINKPSLSIDDVLASSLAAFLSSSIQPPKLSPSLIVKAPEFANEENDNDGTMHLKASNSSPPYISSSPEDEEQAQQQMRESLDSPVRDSSPAEVPFRVDDPSMDRHENTGTVNVKRSSTPCISPSHEWTNSINRNSDDIEWTINGSTEDITNGATNPNHSQEESTENSRTDSCTEEIVFQSQRLTEWAPTIKEAPITGQFFAEGNDLNSTADIANNGPATVTELQTASLDVDGLKNKDIQTSNFTLDFELPILDVKFVLKENWTSGFSLEALLGDPLEAKSQASDRDERTSGFSLEALLGDPLEAKSQASDRDEIASDLPNPIVLPLESLLGDMPETKTQASDCFATDLPNYMVFSEVEEPIDPAVNNQFPVELEDGMVRNVCSCSDGEEVTDPFQSGR
ncbi:40S ribosomal protein S27 isoform X2 [Tasmannia lanceolata]|uniref:40S ribosomal protein S27 isoform X2 n=1 Tax=Tasmannia lanceolata TaxID=3420 RepID=UPI0040628EB5